MYNVHICIELYTYTFHYISILGISISNDEINKERLKFISNLIYIIIYINIFVLLIINSN